MNMITCDLTRNQYEALMDAFYNYLELQRTTRDNPYIRQLVECSLKLESFDKRDGGKVVVTMSTVEMNIPIRALEWRVKCWKGTRDREALRDAANIFISSYRREINGRPKPKGKRKAVIESPHNGRLDDYTHTGGN